jgi:hypothetical protein
MGPRLQASFAKRVAAIAKQFKSKEEGRADNKQRAELYGQRHHIKH